MRIYKAPLPFIFGLLILFVSIMSVAQAGNNDATVRAAESTVITVCPSGCDYISLKEAIDNASPGDTIQISALTTNEQSYTVDKDLIIKGAGIDQTILQGADSFQAATSRVITINPGVNATISSMTIRYGNPDGEGMFDDWGGGILNMGHLTLSNTLIYSNFTGLKGGGIANVAYDNDASLTIISSTIQSNIGDHEGGGIITMGYSRTATLDIIDSELSDNRVIDTNGGGISSIAYGKEGRSNVTISGSTFYNNRTTDGNGGAIGQWVIEGIADLLISDSTLENNHDDGKGTSFYHSVAGGGVSTISAFNSSFDGQENGNGAYSYVSDHGSISTINIQQCTFHADNANTIAVYSLAVDSGTFNLNVNQSAFYVNSDHSTGIQVEAVGAGQANILIDKSTIVESSENNTGILVSALSNGQANTIIDRSTITSTGNNSGVFNNVSTAGISNIEIKRSTLSGKTEGIGIKNFGTDNAVAQLDLNSSTITGWEYGIGNMDVNSTTAFTLTNSIIANAVTTECVNLDGTLVDNGYNLSTGAECISAATSIVGDPLLAPLADNGGATWTHALLDGSPALDAIPPELCAFEYDQRGWPRPIGIGCDIGAFEAGSLVHLPLVTRAQ